GLAALLEAEEQRPPVAEHGRAAREDAGQLTDEERTDERRDEPFRDVEQHDRDAVAAPELPPHVGGADVPAPDLADVDALRRADEPVPEGHAADEVAGDHDERARHSAAEPKSRAMRSAISPSGSPPSPPRCSK